MVAMMEYSVCHLDLDAFFASVEEADNPKLRGKPLVVGGRSKRGIITTANYEARKYGIHSAMPLFMARELCPQLLVVRGRMDRYIEVSHQVFQIFKKYSDKVEQVSIDEAYLDFSNIRDPLITIDKLKKDLKKSLDLTISAGISYNKFLAKMASDWNKPNGLMVISKDQVPDIYLDFACGKIHGIGKKTDKKLRDLGIFTVRDMLNLSLDFMEEHFGKAGEEIYHRIRGEDNRKIEPNQKRKSYGVERTFTPTRDIEGLKILLTSYAQEIWQFLEKSKLSAATLNLKIKTGDFKTISRSKTNQFYFKDKEIIINTALDLFKQVKVKNQIRLLGLSVSNFKDRTKEQLDFLSSKSYKREK